MNVQAPIKPTARQNRDRILSILRKFGPMTRAQLDRFFPDVKKNTFNRYLTDLRKAGVVTCPKHGVWETHTTFTLKQYSRNEAMRMESMILEIMRRQKVKAKPKRGRPFNRKVITAEVKARREELLQHFSDIPITRAELFQRVPSTTVDSYTGDMAYFRKKGLIKRVNRYGWVRLPQEGRA